MLSKKNRADKRLIDKIFKEGKFVNSPNLTLKFINTKEGNVKISFITPKTVSKRAVDRNLLRRRGYVILKKHLSLFPIGFIGAVIFGKKSMVFFGGRKNKTKNPNQNLEKEINIILNKLKF
ncbi:MAG: ribonuclease P protein component [bacterium]